MAAPTEPEAIPAVDELAQEIRRVDGSNSLGAGALAEALMPFFIRASRAPVDGAEAEPVAWQRLCGDGTWSDDISREEGVQDAWKSWGFESRPLYPQPAPASPDAEMVKRETFQSCGEWADATFGPATVLRRLERAEEELAEAKAAEPNKVMEEIADVVICLAAAAHSFGGDLQVAIDAKMAINRKREWDVRGDGTGYHVSSSDAVAPLLSKHGGDRS